MFATLVHVMSLQYFAALLSHMLKYARACRLCNSAAAYALDACYHPALVSTYLLSCFK
jgi:hypothetical protein